MSAHALAADLAARFKLKRRPRSWAGTCPACGYARAFSLRVGKGSHPLLHCGNGCGRDELDAVARDALGGAWAPRPAPDAADEQAKRERKQAAALRLFSGADPVRPGDPAGRYLAGRGLVHLVGCPALRHHGDCPHPEGGRHPALVARVLDAAGRPVACHRTYLTPDGAKAAADPVRASLGPIWGGAVRLTPAAAPPAELAVGEGIETAGSAGLLLGLPAWAALSAGNLARGLLLPAEVVGVVIAADPDPAGLDAACAAATRWLAEGRRVRVATPDRPGQDFNDLLLARPAAEVAHG